MPTRIKKGTNVKVVKIYLFLFRVTEKDKQFNLIKQFQKILKETRTLFTKVAEQKFLFY